MLEGRAVRYQVVFQGVATRDPQGKEAFDPDGLERELEGVMEELLKLKVEDATVGGTLARGEVEISVTVEANDFQRALEEGNALIRTAIHASGGLTPEWSLDWTSVKTARLEALARP